MGDRGTLAWAARTQGDLTLVDRAQLTAQVVKVQVGLLTSRGWATGDVDLPSPPDSPLATWALECVRDLSSPGLLAHCRRTWAFGALLASLEGISYDPELWWLAALMHDLGLTPAHDRVHPTARCFAVEGAWAAQDALAGQGLPAERARTVAEAICLHLNITVGLEHGPEAHLLNRAALLDVIGREAQKVPRPALQRVLERWPREDTAGLVSANSAQARVRPRSRAAFLDGLPFAARILAADPLDRLRP